LDRDTFIFEMNSFDQLKNNFQIKTINGPTCDKNMHETWALQMNNTRGNKKAVF